MKRNNFVKIRLSIRRDKNDDLMDHMRFLSAVRSRFAFRNIIEPAGTKGISSDSTDYNIHNYDLIVERTELFALQRYINDIKDYVNFTVEIEERL